jgi:hypothetical protein
VIYVILGLLAMSYGGFWYDRKSVKPEQRAFIKLVFVLIAGAVLLSEFMGGGK